MARYVVGLENRSSNEVFHVFHESPEYREAWVSARTVCRLGTLFKDDPRCKNPAAAREFFRQEDGEKFPVSPSVYVVRSIFAEHTNKKGKTRMRVITAEQVLAILHGRDAKISKKLETTLLEVLSSTEGGGLRLTVAAAKRLGLEDEIVEEVETTEAAQA